MRKFHPASMSAAESSAERREIFVRSIGTAPITSALSGAVMRGPLQAGAVVTASLVDRPVEGAGAVTDGTNAAPAYRELALDLPAARAVGGGLRPGDRVDVVATADAASHVLVQQALVMRADGSDGSPLGGSEVSVTLALPDAASALAVAHGAAAAELTLLRSTRADQPLPDTYQLPGTTTRTGVACWWRSGRPWTTSRGGSESASTISTIRRIGAPSAGAS